MKYFFSLIIFLIIFSNSLTSQTVTPTCGNHLLEANDRANTPNYDSIVLAYNKQVKNYIASHLQASNLLSSTAIYYIPVVVHVIKTTGMTYGSGTNISYAQIQSQINALNVAFAASQANYQGVFSVDTKIQFCLASNTEPSTLNWSLDPSNAIEYGVMRYDVATTSDPAINVVIPALIGTSFLPFVTLTNDASVNSFNKNNYLNIWVVDQITVNSLTGTTPAAGVYFNNNFLGINQPEGVIMDADCFGENTLTGNAYNLWPGKQDGKTLAHEIGHFLGLQHTFYPNAGMSPIPTGSCYGTEAAGTGTDPCDLNGDGICDIAPMSAGFTGQCNPANRPNSCPIELYTPACGVEDLPSDYMSYEDDPCWNTFTNDQKLRMWATLNIKWLNLWTTSNLIYTGLIGNVGCVSSSALNSDIDLTAPYACVGKSVNFTTLTCLSGNAAVDWSWTIAGSSLPSYYSTNCTTASPPAVIFSATGSYNISLTVTDILGNTQTSTISYVVVDCAVDPDKKSQSNWHFGDYVSLDFSTGVPVKNDDTFIPQTSINSDQTLCTSISDNSGNDLYYGNGVDVWNASHAKINTGGPLPSSSGTAPGLNNLGQSYSLNRSISITIPAPGFPNRYYIFNTPNPGYSSGTILSTYQAGYALIDLTSGGSVVNQGLLPLPGCVSNEIIAACVTAIPHCNGKDYWVIFYSRQNRRFYVYLVTQNGVTNANFTSPAADAYPSCTGSFNFDPITSNQFQLKASPLGNKIAISGAGLTLYDFNSATGAISNELITPNYNGTSLHYGCSFSPNGQYVYTTAPGYVGVVINDFVIKYDIASNTNTALFLPFNTVPTYMQIGPNNHIYFSNFASFDYLSEVPNPDAATGNIAVQYNVSLITAAGLAGSPKRMRNSNTIVNNVDAKMPPFTAADFTIQNPVASCPTYIFDINNCYKNYTITWNFGDGSPAVNGTSVTHVFNTGSYVVTATLSGPLVTTPIVITHNVNVTQTGAPNANAGANQTICQGSAVTLNGSGNGNYQWTPASSGLSCYTCPSPVASPLITTVYTLDVTNSCGTQSSNVTVTVGPACTICDPTSCPNTLVTGAVAPANNTYCINSNLTIIGTKLFIGSEFRIAPGVRIIIPSGANLIITNSHLYSCYNMWQGIEVQNGGKLSILNNSLIEDAIIAVDITNNTQTATVLNVLNSTFNKNQTGININNYTQNVTPSPFNISNSIFTCRVINPQPTGVKYPVANIGAAVTSNAGYPLGNTAINNSTYPETATLKSPFALTKPTVGLRLTNVGVTLNPQSTTPTYNEFKLGNATGNNIFDNHITCVDLINSNFTSVNNIYQNTVVTGRSGSTGGVAINANSATAFNNRLQVTAILLGAGGNKFVNCSRAINSINYFEHVITNNDFRSTQVDPGNALSVTNHAGSYGVYINTNRYRVCNVSDNSLYNIENGLIFTANFGPMNIPGVVDAVQYAGKVNFDRNTIRPHLAGNTVSTQYVSNCIQLENIIGSNVAFANNILSIIQAANNNLTDVYRGIGYRNWKTNNIICNSNTVVLKNDPYVAAGAPTQYGVGITKCAAYSSLNSIRSNNVTGFGLVANPNAKGIIQNMSDGSLVNCNTTGSITNGIEFAGPNLTTTFSKNFMSGSQYGFVLSNSGTIGQQGNATTPQDNQWTGSWTGGNFKTATLNSSALNSKFYIRTTSATSPFNPNNSAYTDVSFGITDYHIGGTFQSLIPTTSNPLNIPCPVIVLGGGGNPPPGILATFVANLEQIVLDLINYQVNATQAKVINKNQVYRLLKEDPSLMAGSAVLQSFYNSSQSTTRKTFDEVETDIAKANLANAGSMNAVVSPTNIIEDNYKSFYDLAIKQAQGSLNTSDSTALAAIAYGCPFTDGAMVYQARSLLNSLYLMYREYPDNCNTTSAGSRLFNKSEEKTEELKTNFDAVLFPNPGATNFNIATFGMTEGNIEINITDVTGKFIMSEKLNVINALALFNLDVKSGIYFIKISTNEKTIIKKLIVQK